MHGFKKEVLEWSNSFQKVKKKGKKKIKQRKTLLNVIMKRKFF